MHYFLKIKTTKKQKQKHTKIKKRKNDMQIKSLFNNVFSICLHLRVLNFICLEKLLKSKHQDQNVINHQNCILSHLSSFLHASHAANLYCEVILLIKMNLQN